MITASAALVVLAFVTLVIGILGDGLGMIWVSIASSIGAAVSLGLGVVRSKPQAAGTGPAVREPEPVSVFEPAPEPTLGRAAEEDEEEAPAPTLSLLGREEAEEELEPEEGPVAAPARKRAASQPARGASRGTGARASAAATSEKVVVIPDRDKFHRDSCRYAKGAAAMTMTKAQARRRGYQPCGQCKP